MRERRGNRLGRRGEIANVDEARPRNKEQVNIFLSPRRGLFFLIADSEEKNVSQRDAVTDKEHVSSW